MVTVIMSTVMSLSDDGSCSTRTDGSATEKARLPRLCEYELKLPPLSLWNAGVVLPYLRKTDYVENILQGSDDALTPKASRLIPFTCEPLVPVCSEIGSSVFAVRCNASAALAVMRCLSLSVYVSRSYIL